MTPDQMAEHIRLFYGPPMAALSDSLRSFIVPAPGKDFIVADYANIEGRGLAWLAGEDWKLDAFRAYDRGEGEDLYLIGATRILTSLGKPPEVPLTKKSPERQSYGKTPELACGFGGSIGAFHTMARNFNLAFTDKEAQSIVQGWRKAHPATRQYWKDLETAAVEAVERPGEIRCAGALGRQIRFRKAGSFLWAQLPSGRCLCYPYPGLQDGYFARANEADLADDEVAEVRKILRSEMEEYRKAGWDTWTMPVLTFMGVDGLTKAWTRMTTYGGSLCENVVSATCRDILAAAMKRLSKKSYDIAFTVHDEVVTEVPECYGSLDEMISLMCELPDWAAGFPITAEGYRAKRYRKG
jgi:DNA polymerase